jgi:hypothetical protein
MKLPKMKSLALRLAILLILTSASLHGLAQRITSFSAELELFPGELEELVKTHLEKDEEGIPEQFLLFWQSDTISTDQKNKVVSISNDILKKTAVNTRQFITFSKIIMLYAQSQKFQTEIDTWLLGLETFAKGDNISIAWISRFLENSLALFTRGTFAINPAFEWKVSNENFNYKMDKTLTIRFYDTDLTCSNNTDSISILSTQGEYFPIEDKWVGVGGKVTWIRSDLPVDDIFATLSKYKINTTRNEYEADSVLYTNHDYFDQPSLGRLKDKITRASNPQNVIYPEFYTYDLRHKINNLFDGVDFDGGYYMLGSQFIGNGTRENPAIIEIKRNNEEFMRVEAQTYIFRRQTVVSDYARVRFKLQSDSLYHSGLGFTYNDQAKLVTIAPTNLLTTQSPILSTYHNFSITFAQLQWHIGDPEMVFSAPMGSSQSRAIFESNNFFNEGLFDELMGRDEQHPLFAVANFTSRIKSKEFKVDEFAKYVRKSPEQVRIQIMRLAMQGYLLYEYETGEVRVLSKLYDAIRAKGKFIDYDVLKFSSYVESGTNAKLDLNTLEMAIRGVENVSISDSQNVFLYPARRELILKENRNFAFDGMVDAGMFRFYGADFNFDYTNFKINSELIDSLRLNYQTKDIDFYGRRILNRVTSTLEVISGEVLIDKPNNKSGLVINEEYPIFNSKGHSFVYYDDESIYNGVYDRENFYFKIEPFTFYSINNFEVEDMTFRGTFFSADIFAPIQDTLLLREDNSLGFRRTFPSEGYAIYKGKGRFYNRIDLSNSGLKGVGRFEYITSSTSSDDLVFFPDSLTTISTEFTIAQQNQGIEYPKVAGKEHSIKWYPYQEKLYAYKGKESFVMFGGEAKLLGNLTLEPLGLTGSGLMDMQKAKLTSKDYRFNALDYSSELANSEFFLATSNELAFTAPEVKAYVSFETRQGEFYKTNESVAAELTPLMYKSHLDRFTWAMEENEITIETPEKQDAVEMGQISISGMPKGENQLMGSLLYSHFNDEDSLYFFSPKVKYNLNQPHITADSVKYLLVADALIIPGKDPIEVDAKKRMLPIKNSQIFANQTQKFHHFYDATTKVTGRKRYIASGTINYVDENDSIQPIFLKEIKVDNKGNSYAETSVTEPDSFKLSPHFGFFGDLSIYAPNKNWTFHGGATPLHACSQIKSSNIYFNTQINPDTIFIPVPELPRNLNQNLLINGSVVTVDSIHLYPSLLSGRKEHTDRMLVEANGFIHFNKNRNRFLIGSKSKIMNPDTTGNLISLSKDFCMLFSEGKVNLPVNLGQIKHTTSGSLTHILADSLLNMDVVLALNFHFNQLALEAMANEVSTFPELKGIDLTRKVYQKYLRQQLGTDDAQKAISQINLFGAMTEIPKGLESTITFADLKMAWDQSNTSFVSKGKIGIGTIGGIQVNKRVDGFVEIYKRNTGDWMIIYLELSPSKYYVFYYNRGAMQVSSHNPLFTDPIKDMRTRERRVRVPAGQIPYNFVVGTRRELQRAQERYNQLLGRDVENVKSAEEEPQENVQESSEENVEENTTETLQEEEEIVNQPRDTNDFFDIDEKQIKP